MASDPISPKDLRHRLMVHVTAAALMRSEKDGNPVVKRIVKAPQLAPGVLPARRSPHYMALDSADVAPLYAFANQNGCGLGFPGYAYLSELSQFSEYRAPAETIAEEMTRRWIKLKGVGKDDKADKIREITDMMEHYRLRDHFKQCTMHDTFFGKGTLYTRIKGQEKPEQRRFPLKLTPQTIEKGSLLGFTAVEPIWQTPFMYNSTDPTLPDFYTPESWYIMGTRTHSDRLMQFVTREVPDLLKPAYNFGGISLTQLMEPYVTRWRRTLSSVNNMIHSYSINGVKTNLAASLEEDDTGASLFNRLELFAKTRDNRGVFALDKDTEEFFQYNTPLSGLSELQAQAQEHMAMPSHMPLVKFTGITPDGLNASSEGEIKVWYDWINARQHASYDGPLQRALVLIQLNEYGSVDPDITFEYVSLDEPDSEGLSRIRKADADAGVAYIDRGVISPDEERERLQLDPTTGYNNLSGSAPGPPEDPDAGEGGEGGPPHEGGEAEPPAGKASGE